MTDEKPQKPTKEYAAAVAAKAADIFKIYLEVIAGTRVMDAEERKKFNEEKDEILAEVRRVRGLI